MGVTCPFHWRSSPCIIYCVACSAQRKPIMYSRGAAMLEAILRERCGLDPRRPVVAGVSGGPDSLCLLDILHQSGYSVIVAHFNHQLRLEAAAEAEAVRELAR